MGRMTTRGGRFARADDRRVQIADAAGGALTADHGRAVFGPAGAGAGVRWRR